RHTSFSLDWSSDVCSSDLARYGIRNPAFRPSPVDPNFGTRYISFVGYSARGDEQRYLDATMAAVDAVEQAIDYLTKFGYTPEQAYTIISVAPCEMHVGGIVDIPNAAFTLSIPVDIFDQDILPTAQRPPYRTYEMTT